MGRNAWDPLAEQGRNSCLLIDLKDFPCKRGGFGMHHFEDLKDDPPLFPLGAFVGIILQVMINKGHL